MNWKKVGQCFSVGYEGKFGMVYPGGGFDFETGKDDDRVEVSGKATSLEAAKIIVETLMLNCEEMYDKSF